MRRALFVLVACSSSARSTPVQSTEAAARPVPPPDAAPAAPPAPPQPAPLTEDMAKSYFTDGDAADGAAKFALEKWQDAKDAFGKALASESDDAQKARLTLMIALCDTHLGNWA